MWKEVFLRKNRAFLDAMKYDLPAPVPAQQILINQAIIDGIVRRLVLGHEITVDISGI